MDADSHSAPAARAPAAAVPGPSEALVTGRVGRAVFSPKGELVAAIIAGVLLLVGFILERVFPGGAVARAGEGCVWLSLALGLLHGGRAAWDALREKKFDIDVLMVIGAGFAAGIGHPEEGALLLFLFVLAGSLEELAAMRTKREIEALHKLMPTEALVLRAGEWAEVDPGSLEAGERIKVRPGERIPTDARLVEGVGSIDQSAITGESLPRTVKPGDELYAGTINADTTLEAIVLRPVRESSLQRILNLVTTARSQREPIQRFIDKVSEPYATGVALASLAVFLIWWLALSLPWKESLYTAITLLIVASPCALIIATPTATLAAIARAARGGVLFKGGQSIDALANISAVCFDKTGTLTFGKPQLYEVHPVGWSDGRELLALAAGLEADSTHPIAEAVRKAAEQRGIDPLPFAEVRHVAGRGVVGLWTSGGVTREVRLGSMAHTEELIPVCFRARVREVLGKMRERGHIAVVVALPAVEAPGGEASDASVSAPAGGAAVLIMADAVRPGAAQLVRELHALKVHRVRMLTGDSRVTAERVAASLGIDEVSAELLPEDKLRAVDELKRASREKKLGGVAVIGDGVNDAPALAAADVSVGIGSIGSDAALESADIVLLSDDLAAVPWAVKLARRARLTVKVNLIFALSVIGLMGVATLVGSLIGKPVPLSIGVLAHEGGTILVVANSLRLLLFPGVGRRADGHRRSE